jgi:hypothetical protein
MYNCKSPTRGGVEAKNWGIRRMGIKSDLMIRHHISRVLVAHALGPTALQLWAVPFDPTVSAVCLKRSLSVDSAFF